MCWNDGELCEANDGAAEAEVENNTLMADGEAAVGGGASLLGHGGGEMVTLSVPLPRVEQASLFETVRNNG